MTKYKIGDRVTCVISFEGYPQIGWKGKVVHFFDAQETIVGVEWVKRFEDGHTCQQHGRQYHCWYYYDAQALESRIEIIKKQNVQMELFDEV